MARTRTIAQKVWRSMNCLTGRSRVRRAEAKEGEFDARGSRERATSPSTGIGMGASACVMSSLLHRARKGDVDARVYPTQRDLHARCTGLAGHGARRLPVRSLPQDRAAMFPVRRSFVDRPRRVFPVRSCDRAEDRPPQRIVQARLPARTALAEVGHEIGVQSDRNVFLRRGSLLAPGAAVPLDDMREDPRSPVASRPSPRWRAPECRGRRRCRREWRRLPPASGKRCHA